MNEQNQTQYSLIDADRLVYNPDLHGQLDRTGKLRVEQVDGEWWVLGSDCMFPAVSEYAADRMLLLLKSTDKRHS